MEWFRGAKRDLPWRRTRDPYAIWISEIMLQQTRVETVIPYFEKFVERFPDLAALAASEVDDVLASWSGLGYYRRARFLHAAARRMVAEGGEFPATIEGLRALPGVGDYTAAAIGSIAFGIAEPVLDGNVERVLARVSGEVGDVKRAATRRELKALARELLVDGRPGASNEALMELGATVCTPKSPRCEVCPWNEPCVARAGGSPEAIPTPRPRRRRERVRRTIFVVREVLEGERSTLLFRRPDDSELLAGTWELPWIDGVPRSSRAARLLAERYGGDWRIGARIGGVRHSVTYRDLEVSVRGADLDSSTAREGRLEAGWFTADALARIAVSSLVAKALALA